MAWNRNSEGQPSPRPRRAGGRGSELPSALLVILAAAVLLAGGFAWWWARRGGDAGPSAPGSREGGLIAEATPASAPKAGARAAAADAERRRRLTPLEKARQQPMHTNVYGYVINRPHTEVVHTNNQALAMLSEAEKVFSNTADRKIASLLTLEPGEMLVGDPSSLFGRGFRRKFMESLERPELVLETDGEDVRALKQAVIDAKADLKARMDAGEDVCEVMLQAYREAQEIGLYRENLKSEVSRLVRDRALDEEDVKDFVAAANKMLSGRGAKPLTMPRFAARRLQLMRERNKKGEENP